jgi:hypothetical protein
VDSFYGGMACHYLLSVEVNDTIARLFTFIANMDLFRIASRIAYEVSDPDHRRLLDGIKSWWIKQGWPMRWRWKWAEIEPGVYMVDLSTTCINPHSDNYNEYVGAIMEVDLNEGGVKFNEDPVDLDKYGNIPWANYKACFKRGKI